MRSSFATGSVRPGPSFLHRSQLGQRVVPGPFVCRVGNQSERVHAAAGPDDSSPVGHLGAAGAYRVSPAAASLAGITAVGQEAFNQVGHRERRVGQFPVVFRENFVAYAVQDFGELCIVQGSSPCGEGSHTLAVSPAERTGTPGCSGFPRMAGNLKTIRSLHHRPYDACSNEHPLLYAVLSKTVLLAIQCLLELPRLPL